MWDREEEGEREGWINGRRGGGERTRRERGWEREWEGWREGGD